MCTTRVLTFQPCTVPHRGLGPFWALTCIECAKQAPFDPVPTPGKTAKQPIFPIGHDGERSFPWPFLPSSPSSSSQSQPSVQSSMSRTGSEPPRQESASESVSFVSRYRAKLRPNLRDRPEVKPAAGEPDHEYFRSLHRFPTPPYRRFHPHRPPRRRKTTTLIYPSRGDSYRLLRGSRQEQTPKIREERCLLWSFFLTRTNMATLRQ